MFRSKSQNLIFPQFEHSRLAGMLAWHWGNADFDRPALDFASFAKGVTLHDWHYGLLDDHPLGEYDHAEWLSIVERGVSIDYADAVTDAVAKRHLRRLIGQPTDAEMRTLVDRLDTKITTREQQSACSPGAFAWADHITRFCDGVAFHFGFENRGWHTASVGADVNAADEKTEIAYQITETAIRFNPWPFGVSQFVEQVIAYTADGYPAKLDPQVILVRCVPAD